MEVLNRLDVRLAQVSCLSHVDNFVYLTLLLVFLAYIEALGGSRFAAGAGSLAIAAASMRASDRLTYRHLA